MYRLEEYHGESHPFAFGPATTVIARSNRSKLVDEMIDATAAHHSGEGYGPSGGTWHAESLFEFGLLDEEEIIPRSREAVRKTAPNELPPVGTPVDRDAFESAGERLTGSVREQLIDDLRGDVIIERGDSVERLDDPWV